jgi:L-threonylcarbamoyladenylate synthase
LSKKPDSSAHESHIRVIDPDHPDVSLICEAARIIKTGGIIIFPTRTLYGIGVDALNPEAVDRVFAVKQRSAAKPVSVLVGSMSAVRSLVSEVPPSADALMEKFWPGRMTIVFKARAEVPINLTAGTGKIGIRVPEHPVAVKLVQSLDIPVTGTSANFSGSQGCHRITDLPSDMICQMSLILDAGPLRGGIGSTVVDVTTFPPTILREGLVSAQEVFGR